MKLNTLRLIFIASCLLLIGNIAYAGTEKPDSGLHGTDVIKEEQPNTRGINVLKGSDITSTQTPPVDHDPSFKESLKELEKRNARQKKLIQETKPE